MSTTTALYVSHRLFDATLDMKQHMFLQTGWMKSMWLNLYVSKSVHINQKDFNPTKMGLKKSNNRFKIIYSEFGVTMGNDCWMNDDCLFHAEMLKLYKRSGGKISMLERILSKLHHLACRVTSKILPKKSNYFLHLVKIVKSKSERFKSPSLPMIFHINLDTQNLPWTVEINHNHSNHHGLITKIGRHGYITPNRKILYSVSLH